jgi:prophage DNA circulation protein
MNKVELSEAVALSQTLIAGVLDTLAGRQGTAGAELRHLCGALTANAAVELDADAGPLTFYTDFAACFAQARIAGATFAALDRVRRLAEAAAPGLPTGIAVKNFAVRVALAEQSKVLAATTFTSRQDVDTVLDQVNANFELAETVAADGHDNVAYRALIALHAAVANDLSTRARPLPRMVTYKFARRLPALTMAQRLYYDGSRANELALENKAVHPAFMPQSGRALSA